jgi:hypothetical protein
MPEQNNKANHKIKNEPITHVTRMQKQWMKNMVHKSAALFQKVCAAIISTDDAFIYKTKIDGLFPWRLALCLEGR